MNRMDDETFPDFPYTASELAKFIAASDLFTIMLKRGDFVHYTAQDKDQFLEWLIEHNVTNIMEACATLFLEVNQLIEDIKKLNLSAKVSTFDTARSK